MQTLHKVRALVLSLALLPAGTALAATVHLDFQPDATDVQFDLGATGHDVHGRLFLESGQIDLDSDGTARGEITLDATRGDTGSAKRDKAMVQKVFESKLHPRIVFRAESFTGEIAGAGTSDVEIHGTVSIAGAEHPLDLPAQLEMDGDTWKATTDFSVPFVDWGMHNPSLLFLRVEKIVEVHVKANGQLKEAAAAPAPTAQNP